MEPTQSPVQDPVMNPVPVSAVSTNRNWLIIISIIAILLLSLSAFFYLQNQKLKKQIINQQVSTTIQAPSVSSITIPADETTNWKIYSNTEGGFSFKYPVNLFMYKDPLVPFFVATSTPQGGNGPKFLGQKDLWIEAETLQGANLKSIDEYLTLPGQPIYPANSQKTPIILGGISGYLIDYSLPVSAGDIIEYTTVAITLKSEKIYTVSLSSWDKNVLQTNKNVLNQILSTFNFLGENSASELLNIKSSGGLCPDGNVCSSTKIIMRDGSVLIDNKLKTKVDLTKLISLINNTNFDEIRSKKFTGTCPTAYDGQEAIYTFYTLTATQTISNCEFEIDNKSPLFSEINKILSNLPNEK